MPKQPRSFPHVVCWNRESRPQVMNTIALDVPASIFRATHYPSFMHRGLLDEGSRINPGERITESDYLKEFLDEDHPHVLDVAVGDPGTGKSHLIRWMFNQIEEQFDNNKNPPHVILIPRSSSNLADVIRRVIKGFRGDIIDRINKELEQTLSITVEGAKVRVLDELAFVLDPANLEVPITSENESQEEQLVRSLLPATLHDNAVRKDLMSRENSIVSHLANHIFGKRERVEEEPPNLEWSPDDLAFEVKTCHKAGADAQELCNLLLADLEIREIAAGFLNTALGATLNRLLGLRHGDMLAAMQEARRELHDQDRDLVLLIEDMSVATGMDAQLLEALLVRSRDTGETLCRLRTIVGLTHEDFRRLQENIIGRIRQVVFLDALFNDQNIRQSDCHMSRDHILDFSSRYLNAARYTLQELNTWHGSVSGDDGLPSYCENANCPNLETCHATFGVIKGRGLYPFSIEAISRLYISIAKSAPGGDSGVAFNPRLIVSRVLNAFLEDAERALKEKHFPGSMIITNFNLKRVGAQGQKNLQENHPNEKNRLRAALELYSLSPNELHMSADISKAFDLPILELGTTVPTVQPPTVQPPTVQPPTVDELDVFDRWLNGDPVADSDLNSWRPMVHEALMANIDWDVEMISHLRSRFQQRLINFEGQRTRSSTGDVILNIKRSPEASITLRGLAMQFKGTSATQSEEWLLCASLCFSQWAEDIRTQIGQLFDTPGIPGQIELAAQVLVFGAFLRGIVYSKMSDAQILKQAMRPWPEDLPVKRSRTWTSLWKSFQRWSGTVKELLFNALVCAKGGSIRETSMIDPTPILTAIDCVRTKGAPQKLPSESVAWHDSAALISLAKEIEKKCEKALSDENQACQKWIKEMDQLIGQADNGNTTFDPRSVIQALEKASASAVLVGRGALDLTNQLQTMDIDALSLCLKQVRKALDANDPTDKIVAISVVDRETMDSLLEVLTITKFVLDTSTTKVKDRISTHGGGEVSVEELTKEIRMLLGKLDRHLKTLDGEYDND